MVARPGALNGAGAGVMTEKLTTSSTSASVACSGTITSPPSSTMAGSGASNTGAWFVTVIEWVVESQVLVDTPDCGQFGVTPSKAFTTIASPPAYVRSAVYVLPITLPCAGSATVNVTGSPSVSL